MKGAILIRTNSIPSQTHLLPSPSSDSSALLRLSHSTTGSLNLKIQSIPTPIRRTSSDTTLCKSISSNRAFPSPSRSSLTTNFEEETEYTGGGIGKGRTIPGSGGNNGGGGEEHSLGDYYKKILEVDPGNSLLLRNYGKFLHEVAGDTEGAEECYGRAILASPGDGELLSLYGALVWEAHRDEERAGDYFQRAVEASPDDCYVMGSYAKFMWDSEEDEGENLVPPSPPMVKAF